MASKTEYTQQTPYLGRFYDNLRMRIYKMPRKEKTMPPTEAAEREKRIMAAVQELKSGKSTRQAAKLFEVPFSALQDHCSGNETIELF